MQERYLGRLEPGMDVCDINGDKIGTVSRVYRHQMADVEASGGVATAPHEEILEVKTGLLGLGKHFWVPLSAIEDVTTGCVFVKQPKDAIDQQGWDTRPGYLDELT
jgi:hypothetical protein